MSDLHSKLMVVLAALAFPVVGLLCSATAAEKRTVVPLAKCLDGWTCKQPQNRSHWTIGIAKMDPNNLRGLIVSPAGGGNGELINAQGHGVDIYTKEKFADCTIELEVMVPKESNSGIYVMGEYEIQILDSYGRQRVGSGDMGGVYGAAAPRLNAAGKPGEWQKFVIDFKAPRFENDKKVANARFVKVELNGQVIHENLEMKKQSGGGVTGREVPAGPLMFQGNHGPVAYRNIKITPLPAR